MQVYTRAERGIAFLVILDCHRTDILGLYGIDSEQKAILVQLM